VATFQRDPTDGASLRRLPPLPPSAASQQAWSLLARCFPMLGPAAAFKTWPTSAEERAMPDEPQARPEPQASWIGVDELPVPFANTFSGIVGPNAVFINIGSTVPPAIESEEDLENMLFIPVKPIARIAMAPGGLDDLIRTLEHTRSLYENLKRAEEEQ
jgi:hypothetical protein